MPAAAWDKATVTCRCTITTIIMTVRPTVITTIIIRRAIMARGGTGGG
ncbi:hypothetical protein PRLR6025_08180 [Prevotella lacticifex]|nr:hypothetical protein PRLR6025_08180 [Prevotella lacticifex]